MMRLRKDKLTLTALGISAFFVLIAILAPFLRAFGVIDPMKKNQELVSAATGGLPVEKWGGISSSHWLGVEPGIGRDTLARLLSGLSFSLGIALTAALIAVTIGVVLGIVAGAMGGWVDAIVGRIIDLTLAFPQTLLLLAFSSTGLVILTNLGVPGGTTAQFVYVVVVLGVFGWPPVARLVRGQVLSLREREFVQASRLIGASAPRIFFKEILPNLWAPILVQFTLILPAYISAEAALGYLQVSVKPPEPTLGNMLRQGLTFADTDFLFFFLPALMVAAMVLAFNLFGDGLRDALDPKGEK